MDQGTPPTPPQSQIIKVRNLTYGITSWGSVGVVPVKLDYRRSKLNRIDVYVAFSLLIAGIVLCPISIFCKSLHSITFTNLN